MEVIKSPRIIIYDDKNLQYYKGSCMNILTNANTIDFNTLDSPYPKSLTLDYTITTNVRDLKELDYIKLDPTTMKRIAKYNKEAEIQKLDKLIEEKQKRIEELDNILQDKDKRVDKIRKYICEIYDIDVSNDYEEDDWDEDDE